MTWPSQLAERTEDLQRVSAEYANYRRRVDRDRSLVVDQAAERFALQLFPIIDDIERARDHGDLTGAFKVVADRVLGLVDGLGVRRSGRRATSSTRPCTRRSCTTRRRR